MWIEAREPFFHPTCQRHSDITHPTFILCFAVLVVAWHAETNGVAPASRPSIREGIGGMLINGYG